MNDKMQKSVIMYINCETATKKKERASKRKYGRKIAYILVLKLISLFCASKLYLIILYSYLDSFYEYLYP